jgi:TPR repeat protein
MPAQSDEMTLEAARTNELARVRDQIRKRLLRFSAAAEPMAKPGDSPPERDDAAVVAQYRQAARQGDGLAAFKVAEAFERGEGVPPDLVEALTWYGIAQRQGYARATRHVEALRGELPSEEVQEASKRIEQWLQDLGSS